MKRYVYGLLAVLLLYYVTGAVLLYYQVVTSFPIAPGFRLKHRVDTVGYSPEGPIVRGNQLYAIERQAGQLHPVRGEVRSQDTLTCQTSVGTFGVRLRDTLSPDPDLIRAPPEVPILTVSDVEGNFTWFQAFLLRNRVINRQFRWTFGAGHLVLLGDFFDRGTEVLPCLWLIYKLEEEARKAGGQVHFVLGNHDAMNLSGNYRYVRKKYLVNADSLRLPYGRWFDSSTELGRWLRTKPTLLKINGFLFCHAGVSPRLLSQMPSIEAVNQQMRASLGHDPKTIRNPQTRQLMGQEGPLWYRGYFMAHDGYPMASQGDVEGVLRHFEVSRLVVGHTLGEAVRTQYNGKVIAIDVERNEPIGQNPPSALLIWKDRCTALGESGERRLLD